MQRQGTVHDHRVLARNIHGVADEGGGRIGCGVEEILALQMLVHLGDSGIHRRNRDGDIDFAGGEILPIQNKCAVYVHEFPRRGGEPQMGNMPDDGCMQGIKFIGFRRRDGHRQLIRQNGCGQP
jgi:hypothetical protein